ncbi:MAG: CCA tRNA nucleotidyltransferase, partial [Xanthobacteraceae bacterium]
MTAATHLQDAPWLRRGEVQDLLVTLGRDGEEARVVGGAVRNELLHLAVSEFDIATTAVPEEVVRRVERAGWKAVPTGIEHGTITVVIDGKPFEVTTLRQDVETYGRKAKVLFGRDWTADAQRRDFTVNALSASADGTVYDYVDGLADIAARRVRFIGDPSKRIAEDYLRILRFFRFHAWYGSGAPDAAGLHACIAARGGLETLSRERVRMELLKLLLAPQATPALAIMAEAGLLGAVLGGVPLLASYENTVKTEAAIGTAGNTVRRLGALGVLVKEDAERLTERLRLSNAEAERLKALDDWWNVTPAAGGRALLYHLGPESFTDCVLVAWSRSRAGAADHAWHELATLPRRWTAPVFPLKATNLMSRGLAAGPALGAALRLAERFWIDTDFPEDRAALDAIADRAAREADAALR